MSHRRAPASASRPRRRTGRCALRRRSRTRTPAALRLGEQGRRARPTRRSQTALVALEKMLHRAGNVDGEGDGCGVLIDIPRKIWAEEIRARRPRVASWRSTSASRSCTSSSRARAASAADAQERARELMSKIGLRVLAERENVVDSLGARARSAREEEPVFWQVGGLIEDPKLCFELTLQLEEELDVHVASCSTDTVVYKVLGAPGGARAATTPTCTTGRAETAAVYGHNRYSTNTWPSLQARPALRRARPQRRDQHDRPPAPGGADARRADPRRTARTRRT